MPTYSYLCTNQECGNVVEDVASMSAYKEHHPKCESCNSECNYIFVPSVPYVSFKDGPSGSWPSKGERFKKYRAKQAEKMDARQKERYGHLSTTAIPNYNGKETGTWREAQECARKERGEESARTYDSKVKSETNPGTKA